MLEKRENKDSLRVRRGRLIAELLAGSWRPSSPTNSETELAEVSELLLRSGAGALVWGRIRNSDLRAGAAAHDLHQSYRMQSLQSELQKRRLKVAVRLLRNAGVEPLVVKGWAIARSYPEAAMRPYVDLDLCVSQDDAPAARIALRSPDAKPCNVDLHVGFGMFCEQRTDEIFARSDLVPLDDVEIRVLGADDNLRFLCMHMLRHGVARPLWMCDIAVLLEGMRDHFDWDRCLSGSVKERRWIACAVSLANQLLDVDLAATPFQKAPKLPRWLVPAVLRSWGAPPPSLGQVGVLLRQPRKLWRQLPREIRRHWPNPIEATFALRAPFNELPRLPFQMGHFATRTGNLLAQLIGDLGGALQHRS